MNTPRSLASQLLAAFSVVTFVVLVLDVLWGVFTRYAIGQQAPWSEEVARLLLVWLSMLGTALAYVHRSHLGVDVLLVSLAPPARHVALVVIYLLVITFALGVMGYGGAALFLERLDSGQVMSTLPMRKAWMYLAIPVSGVLMGIVAIGDLVQQLRSGLSDAPAVEPR
jgi:TRAP-type C4-dicarboxylate transport system permease small subunit